MRYWAPINSVGGIRSNDGYSDANPEFDIEGSVPTFRIFEQTMRELQNFVVKSGLHPDDVMNAIQIAQSVQNGKVIWATDTGTVNRMAVTIDPTPEEIIPGFMLKIAVKFTNTISDVTLTVNGTHTRGVIFSSGNPLLINSILAAMIIIVIFDGTKWRLININEEIINKITQAAGTNTVIYDSGSGFFNVPADIYWLHDIEVTGAGGGGGGGGSGAGAGAGGNGGNYVRGSLAVTPGQAISYYVGVGGYGGTPSYDGGGGGSTYFGPWIATGGSGGQTNSNPGASNPGSTGGSVHITGQQGDGGRQFPSGFTQYWGGRGGDSAGGGMGGNGSVNGGTGGNPGLHPGGGAGGGTAGGAINGGGNGANGRVLIRY